MDLIVLAIVFIFTFIISSQIIFLFLTRIFQKYREASLIPIFFLSLGLGPILISLVAQFLLDIFPYHSKLFYIQIFILIFLPFVVFGFNQIKSLINTYKLIIKNYGLEQDAG